MKNEYYRQNIKVDGYIIDCVRNHTLLYRVKFINNEPVDIYHKKDFDITKINIDFLLKQDL
jgi:hypothetical protein